MHYTLWRLASAAMRRSLSAMSAFLPPGAPSRPGSPKIIWQARTMGDRGGLITQSGVTVCLEEETEPIVLPLRRVHDLTALEVLQRFLVVADMPVHFAPRTECYGLWIELNNFIEVFQRTLRVAKLHPGQVAIKIGMRIGWILLNPIYSQSEDSAADRCEEVCGAPLLLRVSWVLSLIRFGWSPPFHAPVLLPPQSSETWPMTH